MKDAEKQDAAFSPTPPPPPRVQVSVGERRCDDEPSDVEEGACLSSASAERTGEPSSEEAVQEASGRERACRPKRRVAAIAVAAALFAIAAVVAFAAIALDRAESASDERAIDPRPSTATARAGEGVPTEETAQAQGDIAAQLAAVAADEDGVFASYVQQFVDCYDAGVDGSTSYGFADLGISSAELAEKLRDGLSFSVESVDVYGSKAWVGVEVTSKSFSDQADVFAASVAAAPAYEDADGYRDYLKSSLLGAFDRVKPRAGDALVVIERTDEGWRLSSDDIASLLGEAWYG